MKNNLYIVHKLPTPYHDDLFRALHDDYDINLQVYHLWKRSNRRPWNTVLATGYSNHFMNTIFGVDWTSFNKAWKDSNSLFLIGDWAHIPCIVLLFARIIRNYPVALWVDTPQEQLQRPAVKQYFRKRFLYWLLNNVDLIFGSGQPAKRALLKMGAKEEIIHDFQFVVDLNKPELFKKNQVNRERAEALRKKIGCEKDGLVFGISGTIDFQKKAQDIGLKTFFECQKKSTKKVGLLVAGAGDQLPKLMNLAREMGIHEKVEFLGWLEPAGMIDFYMAIDVLFHPAYYDPFPLVVIEAMSWGIPVIGSTTCGSIEERVISRVNGFTVEVGNVSEMVAAMQAFEDINLLKDASINARETAETWPISRVVEIVKKALNKYVN